MPQYHEGIKQHPDVKRVHLHTVILTATIEMIGKITPGIYNLNHFSEGDASDLSSQKASAHSWMITTAFNWSGFLGIQCEARGCVCGSRLPSAGRLFFGDHNQSPNQGTNAPAPGSPALERAEVIGVSEPRRQPISCFLSATGCRQRNSNETC